MRCMGMRMRYICNIIAIIIYKIAVRNITGGIRNVLSREGFYKTSIHRQIQKV